MESAEHHLQRDTERIISSDTNTGIVEGVKGLVFQVIGNDVEWLLIWPQKYFGPVVLAPQVVTFCIPSWFLTQVQLTANCWQLAMH